MTLWYFETVGMTGRWSPCTAPEKPETAMHGGHLREKRVSGLGPRIRRIVEAPAGLHGAAPADLRRYLWGEADDEATDPRQREVAR